MTAKNTANPVISVLMPCFNGARWVSESIDSVLKQTFTDLELIIVDGGSTDGSVDIIQDYIKRDARIVLINRPGLGLSASLNLGIESARGEWIARLDADDIAEPERLALQLQATLENPQLVFLGTGLTEIDEHGRLGKSFIYPQETDRLLNNLVRFKRFPPHSSAFYLTDVVKKAGGYRTEIKRAEDLDLWLRLSELGALGSIPQCLVIDARVAVVGYWLRQRGAPDASRFDHPRYLDFRAFVTQQYQSYFRRHIARDQLTARFSVDFQLFGERIAPKYFWPESFRINEVVESLIDVGCEVTVLTGQPNYPHGKTFEGYRALQVSTETHPRGYVIHRVPLLPRGKSNTLVGPFVLRGQKFDLIFVCGMSPFTQSVSAIWLGKLKSAKVVIWVQDLWPESLEASGFVKNKTVLLQSKGFRSSVEKMSGATPIEYHPNPGELAFNQHTSHEQAPSVALGKGFNVVFAGNMGTVQALDKVLDAAEMLLEHNAINIVLIGSGSLTTWIETEIKRRNLTNVTMPGRFPVEAMPGILAQASALLVSLCRDPIISKTIPSKVQVYLAAGKPIIASLDGEGAAVVEESGAGVSCPAEDAAALAQGILKLYGLSPQQLELLGKQGVAYYQEHFEPNMLATRLRDHFATVLSNRARSATEDAAN
eukprot:gene2297-2335_t